MAHATGVLNVTGPSLSGNASGISQRNGQLSIEGPKAECSGEAQSITPGQSVLHITGPVLICNGQAFALEDGHLPPAIEIHVWEMYTEIAITTDLVIPAESNNNIPDLHVRTMPVTITIPRSQ